jgi:hypothetical protein
MSKEEIMEALADDQMKHAESPAETAIDDMYDAMAGSASQEYQIAH